MREDPQGLYMSVGYVLVNVEPGSEVEVFNTASKLSFVTDSNLLFGDHDLIVKLEAENMGDIARLVVESIRAIPGVLNTKTLACAEM
jgi:DNA-binding Lrp family transcriptional regulator|tara:strand:+ start:1315 stop:1575 length:261 start_codon:yes stop_codon:yes gene_type:complete